MALEDAPVLAELLLGCQAVDDDLWTGFSARRQDRVRAIVDWSLQLCRWQVGEGQGDVVPALTARVAQLVSEPA